MSFQYIIDNATGLAINKNPLTSLTITRDQTVRSVDRGGAVYRFAVDANIGMRWSEWRSIITEIEALGKTNTQVINLAKPAFAYITAYTGKLTAPQLAATKLRYTSTMASVTTKAFELSTLPSVAANTVIFNAGDIIQPSGSQFPYTVTATVLRGISTTVTVPVHRTIRSAPSNTYYSTLAGQQVTWKVICTQLPNWKITSYDMVEWGGGFEFYESLI